MNLLSSYLKAAILISLFFVSCKPAEVNLEEPESVPTENIQDEVIQLIVNMPAEQKEQEVWVNEQLVEMGPKAVHVLTNMLTDPAIGSDLQARYALSSMANYVARPGASSERMAFETAMLAELKRDHSQAVTSFLMEQVRLSASDKSVPVLQEYLTDETLHNKSLKVLLTIDSPAAARAIRQTLSSSEGEPQVAMIKALGELRDNSAVGVIENYAVSDDWALTRMSLYALSKIGEPGANPLYEEAIGESDGFRKSEIISFYLNYAEALQMNGYSSESDMITRTVLDGEYPSNIKSSALQIQFDGSDRYEMSDELIETALDADAILAKTSLRLLNELEGDEVTESLIDGMRTSSEVNSVFFIEALGDRKDPTAVPVLQDQLNHSNSEIRGTALKALFQIQDDIDPALVIERLNRATSEEEIEEVERILFQLKPDVIVPAAASALPATSHQAKPILIQVLATYESAESKPAVLNEWNSESEDVRMAVADYLSVMGETNNADLLADRLDEDISEEETRSVQNALVSILNRSVAENQLNQRFYVYFDNGSDLQMERLLQIVPDIDGIDKVDILESSLQHSSPQIRSASADVIGSWNSTEILLLFDQAASEIPDAHYPAFVSNFTQVIDRSDLTLDEKEQMIHEWISGIDNVSHIIELLSQVAESNHLLGLQTVSDYFYNENDEIKEASVQILTSILEPHYSRESNLLNVPNSVLAVLDEEIRDRATSKLMQRDNDQQESGEGADTESQPVFGTLFNGQNLNGWEVIGTQDTWSVENEILFTDGDGSGWLSTENQYDDFVIELEYRVPEGGNSGLFIRSPRDGNPAYEGLEIQILDDYAERYAELQPWQYTGSIYFEEAVSKRVTKQAGEWQSMKVRAEGPTIRVTVNGELVINTNLVEYMENVPNHPGLLQRSGYIGLQNHGEKVEFRNIRIHRVD